MTAINTNKPNRILSFLGSTWKELFFFTIGLFFNSILCYPKKWFTIKGLAKDENYKILSNSKVEIPGIGTFYTNSSGEFIIPRFKTQLQKLTWWPGCNCTTDELILDVMLTDTAENLSYCKKETIKFSEQKEDTIKKTFYLIKDEE